MPINIAYEGDVVILSNFGALLNDPRHFDASRDVRAELEKGRRRFVLDLRGLRDLGSAGLGLLMTISRLIRHYDGDAVVADLGPETEKFLDEMRMDTYWEFFKDVEEALAYYRRRSRRLTGSHVAADVAPDRVPPIARNRLACERAA